MKSFFKKIAKGIKTGLKSVGKAFKKVFKGIGKFVGKLGPIGMLGMMLLMPQLGAWWGQFGTWAGTQAGALGSVMKGIHAVGATVGSAYNTVTGGIQKTLNVATGGTFSAAGAAGYEAGYSDQLASWLGGKADSAREFLGLETQQNRAFTQQVEKLNPTHANYDQVEYDKFINAPTGQELGKTLQGRGLAFDDILNNPDLATQLGNEFGYVKDLEGYVYSFDDLNASTFGEIQSGSKPFRAIGQVGQGLDLSQAGTPNAWKLSGDTGWVAPPKFGETPKDYGKIGRDTAVKTGTTGIGAAAKESSTLSKIGKVATTTGSVLTVAQQLAGDSYYDDDAAYSGYVAENMLPMYESANVDWLQQGLAGAPYFGAGNAGYFQSVVNAEQIDPWYAYMRNV